MANQTIFILGDSTSMTIGCERHMYPYLLADRACWHDSTEVVNCSQPGFTSADACAFYFHQRAKFKNLKAVVLHLGTCDATSWEIKRGRYTKIKETYHRLRKTAGIRKDRIRLNNRLLHFEWNSLFDPSIESPEEPESYHYNISRIVAGCIRSSIQVVMIRPKANNLFLPGVGKGNFVFYRYLGINDKISNRLKIPDERLPGALKFQEAGDFPKALDSYRKILLNPDGLSQSREYPLVIVNNYAVCAAENGELEESEFLFHILLKERDARKEIVNYNLAMVYQMMGNEAGYEKYLTESREMDSSMYRIRSPYLNAFDRLCEKFKKQVRVIDMETFIDDSLYIDHTHPIKKGQALIAEKVYACLKDCLESGTATADINNILFNPELSLGNTTEFFKYYRTEAAFSEQEISDHVTLLKESMEVNNDVSSLKRVIEGFPREIKTALNYHLNHPCFPSLKFLVYFAPQYPVDVGRFPEFFLIRFLIPYLRLYEKKYGLDGVFKQNGNVLRSSSELFAILPATYHSLVEKADPVFDTGVEKSWLEAILMRIRELFLNHLRQGNQICERMKTTIFWYFRESLRYGSHSRVSMRYERTVIENIAEALAVAMLLNDEIKAGREKEIHALIEALEETVLAHESYCHRYGATSDSDGLLVEYDRKMNELADRVEKIEEDIL